MHFYLKARFKKWGVISLIPWLSACTSMAPGMHLGSNRVQEANVSTASPIMTPITPQLLQTERQVREQQPAQDISSLVAKPKPYRIDSGDILSIIVWGHPELATAAMPLQISPEGGLDNVGANLPSAGFVVDHEGLVQFPFVGAFKMRGLTEGEARNQLTAKLARYIKKPDLTLRVQAYRSKRVYIDGEVKLPGSQVINDVPMTLLEAVNRAGGFLPTGDQSQIRISRAGLTYPISIPQLVQKGINPASILLQDGDIVRVRASDESKVFVLGEVTQPKAILMHNGRLTLNEVLGEAGGVNPVSGNAGQVYVVRNVTGADPLVYHLDARSPIAFALAEDFELKPKDVVYVDAVSLATWNRVISLILPSALSAVTTYQAAKQ